MDILFYFYVPKFYYCLSNLIVNKFVIIFLTLETKDIRVYTIKFKNEPLS